MRLFLLFCVFCWTAESAMAIDFEKVSYKEALEQSKKEFKLIFVDAYASWCGPCKRMAKDVFPDQRVSDFFNKHFINLKIDMEKGEGPALARSFQITSYPTFLFINQEGEIIHSAKGGRSIEQFIELAKEALSKNDVSEEIKLKYEQGNRDIDFLYNYAYALRSSGKPSTKVVNDYVKQIEQFTSEKHIQFLFDFCIESDSKVFELFIDHKNAIISKFGLSSYENKAMEACLNTVSKAVEFSVDDLMKTAKKNYKLADSKKAKLFNMKADIHFHYLKDELEECVKHIDKYLKSFGKKNPSEYYLYAYKIHRKSHDPNLLGKALEWLENAKSVIDEDTYSKTKKQIQLKLVQH